MKKMDVKTIAQKFDATFQAALAKKDWEAITKANKELQVFLSGLSSSAKQHAQVQALKETHQKVLDAAVEDARQLRDRIDQHQQSKEGLAAYSAVGQLA